VAARLTCPGEVVAVVLAGPDRVVATAWVAALVAWPGGVVTAFVACPGGVATVLLAWPGGSAVLLVACPGDVTTVFLACPGATPEPWPTARWRPALCTADAVGPACPWAAARPRAPRAGEAADAGAGARRITWCVAAIPAALTDWAAAWTPAGRGPA